MKILVINCGSSSLKYQLIAMEGEKVLCKSLCERIGMVSSMITHEANGHKATTPAIFPTHTEAFAEVVKKMTILMVPAEQHLGHGPAPPYFGPGVLGVLQQP